MSPTARTEASLPNHLRYWRNRRRVSLSQLSARLETAGRHYTSPKTLNRWEKGETPLPSWALAEIALALKVSEPELLHGPRDADPGWPINVSSAYTGLGMAIAEQVVSLGYTSWIASRPDDARRGEYRALAGGRSTTSATLHPGAAPQTSARAQL